MQDTGPDLKDLRPYTLDLRPFVDLRPTKKKLEPRSEIYDQELVFIFARMIFVMNIEIFITI